MIFGKPKDGILDVELNIMQLYRENPKGYERFQERIAPFLNSDPYNSEVIDCESLEDGVLKYRTECIVPRKSEGFKVPLLFLLGNPASHSVYTEMPFAYEGKVHRREHRFWRVLSKTGVLSFKAPFDALSSQERKKELIDGDYDSAFRIGLATFFSMPSSASGDYGEVNGLRKLLGTKALRAIGQYEKKRIENLIKDSMGSNGAVFAFYKGAYNGIKNPESQPYTRKSAVNGMLQAICDCHPEAKLFCLPPTRNIQGKKATEILCRFKREALEP